MTDVLIVEDEFISAQYLKKLLEENGMTVCAIAENAEDALDAVRRCDPDLILVDIILEGNTSGCELALELRRFNQDIVIIFLSAHADQEMLDYALDVNAYSYLLKPYRDKEIVTTVKMALKQKRSRQPAEHIYLKNGYRFDREQGKLLKHNTDTLLSGKRLQLVALLAENRGSTVAFETISRSVNGNGGGINAVRSLVHRIKQGFPDLEIHSVSKKGYVLY